jgi:hypothetical protein
MSTRVPDWPLDGFTDVTWPSVADLVLVEVAVKVNEVVKVDEAVELADVATIVVAGLG